MRFWCLILYCLIIDFSFAANKRMDELHLKREDMPSDLKVVDDIVYKQVGDQKLELMLFPLPNKKDNKAPLVVYIHGGGWSGGDRYGFLRPHLLSVIRGLNRQGAVCASIDYRLAKPGIATVMESVADCKDALRFLVNNAQRFGIDPQRIAVFGTSAGGHLSLVTALGEEKDYPCDHTITGPAVKVRCVAAFYPRVSFSDPALLACTRFPMEKVRSDLEKIVGGSLEEKKAEIHKLSPIELLKSDSPPLFITHGDRDDILPVSNALEMTKAAQSKGVPVEMIICKGAAHCFDGTDLQPTEEEISGSAVEFLMRNLKVKND